METFLFYDTETTGLPLFKKPSEDSGQPHIAQIAAELTDVEGHILGSIDLLIRPDGWSIPREVQELTGITMDMALQGGVDEAMALAMFLDMHARATRRVAHNDNFDARIIRIAQKRYGWSDGAQDLWKAAPSFCTMEATRNICKLPPTEKMRRAGITNYKSPKLEEAYAHVVDRDMEGAHNAAWDVRACKAVFFAVRGMKAASLTDQ